MCTMYSDKTAYYRYIYVCYPEALSLLKRYVHTQAEGDRNRYRKIDTRDDTVSTHTKETSRRLYNRWY